MKRIYIHADTEGPFWNGGGNTAGELHCGLQGFLEILEVAAGLTGSGGEDRLRPFQLAEKLTAASGFWQASAAAHPLRVAHSLIELYDFCRLAGWNGEGSYPQLRELWEVTRGLPVGLAERLDALIAHPPTPFAILHLHTDRGNLPPRWNTLLEKLEEKGFALHVHSLEPSVGNYRLYAPAQARGGARELTVWIQRQLAKHQTIGILGADLLLDTALTHAGLPRSGAHVSAESGSAPLALLTLLPLLAGEIPHPERMLEFLLLPRTPLSHPVFLADALHEWPAVNSPVWEKRLQDIREEMEPDDYRKLAQTLERLLRGADTPTKAEYQEVLLFLKDYAGPRCGEGAAGAEDWRCLLHACDQVEAQLEAWPDSQPIPLRFWCEIVREAIRKVSAPAFPAEAGLVFVDHPGQLLAPVDVLVWWNFTQAAAPAPLRAACLPRLRSALADVGVNLTAFEEAGARLCQESWLRAASAATQTLLLVTPAQDPAGEALHPHPALECIRPRSAGAESCENLLEANAHPGEARAPRPLRELTVSIPARETESPSGLDSLFSCPMKWVLTYHASLKPTRARPLKSGSLLQGSVFHELIAQMQLSADPDQMATELNRVFMEKVPQLAALWCLPGGKNESENARAAFLRAVRVLSTLISPSGGLPASETEYEQVLEGKTLKGRIDLTLPNPPRIVDFKTGLSGRDKTIRDGTAVQLLAYSLLLNPHTPPPVLFLIINQARLLPGPAGQPVTDAEKTALLDTWDTRLRELGQGRIRACGIPPPGGEVLEKATLEAGLISLPPGCAYCRFDRICGRKPVMEKKA